ncbi:PREDICTED: SUMO-interacting motif-containing protein 1, partial [Acanthisitta chloris]|uniref:SUMO-interacting motif-containing protein 1 n=1 Tax=Acanthisitta chloris TaxID=57068 RepID=UPI0004F0D7DC
DIIDLTCEDTSTDLTPLSSLVVIDLTEDTCSPPHPTSCADQLPGQAPAAPEAHMFHPWLCTTTKQETDAMTEPSPAPPWYSTPVKPSATTDMAEGMEDWSCLSSASSCHSSCSSEQDCSTTTFNSDMGSLASMQLDSDLLSPSLSPSPPSLDSNSSWIAGDPEEDLPHIFQEEDLPPRLSPVTDISTTPGKAQGPLLEQKPESISSGKLSMVHTTMEEDFLEGTLHFLNEFVSCQHCPPKEIISHLIRQILLNPHEGMILKDTYMLLMKIQMLHPASAATVGWDWTLLKFTMEDQAHTLSICPQEKPPGQLLFLQYVVQTLEDDFQRNLKLHLLQKSIAKKVLSCDMCFNNVKEVVEWLVAAVTGVQFSQPQEQLQEPLSSSARMLSLAVEVDRSPTCNSCKIADAIFPFMLNIPLRSQREAFLNTMESQLLRCKLLEVLFLHSCDMPTTLPMSLEKILYFLSHSSMLLQYQVSSPTSPLPSWDEMLQYLNLLLMSYQSVILEHLRSELSDRMELIVQRAKPKLQDSDDISHLDIQLKIEDFIIRVQKVLGQPFPPQIQEKLCMLQELLSIATATWRQPLQDWG